MFEQAITNGMIAGLTYALVALGFSLVFETCRFFDLGQGGIYVLGFYVTYFCTHTLRVPLTVSCILAIAVAACAGSLLYGVLYARVHAHATGTVPMLVASLAVLTLTENVVSLIWGPDTRTIRPQVVANSIAILKAHVTTIQIASMGATIAVYSVVGGFRHFTSWGRLMRAVGNDRQLARIVGIRVERITTMTVAVASGITALAAILASLDTDMSPSAGLSVILVAWVTTILGGSGRIANVLLAGLVLGLIQNIAVIWTSTSWQDVIVYAVLLLVLLWRPRGLAGVRTAVIEG